MDQSKIDEIQVAIEAFVEDARQFAGLIFGFTDDAEINRHAEASTNMIERLFTLSVLRLSDDGQLLVSQSIKEIIDKFTELQNLRSVILDRLRVKIYKELFGITPAEDPIKQDRYIALGSINDEELADSSPSSATDDEASDLPTPSDLPVPSPSDDATEVVGEGDDYSEFEDVCGELREAENDVTPSFAGVVPEFTDPDELAIFRKLGDEEAFDPDELAVFEAISADLEDNTVPNFAPKTRPSLAQSSHTLDALRASEIPEDDERSAAE